MTLILSEDEALKTRLSGMTVSDAKNNARTVSVFFGQPDLEIREQSYPYITIQLTDLVEDTQRAHRGIIDLNYTPDGATATLDGKVRGVEYPIPVDLHYQVATYSRHPYHDRALILELLKNRLNLRFGFLLVETATAISMRRLDLLGYSKRDVAEQDKRLFVNLFSIRVSSEMQVSEMIAAAGVLAVHTTFNTLTQTSFTI
jgi:hypothetical protein